MSNDYDEYEKECELIREENEGLLSQYEDYLKNEGLSKKVIDNHISNIDFYINEFLLYEDATEAIDGILHIDMFLGYWFIKKAMWASVSSIKSNASSIKKFYTFLYEKGDVEEGDLNCLKETIKENKQKWIDTLKRYDDLNIEDMNEVWGL